MSDHASAYPPLALRALLRSAPEDFQVDELLGFAPEGEGGHLWVHIEKRGCNTDWVAAELALWANCPLRDVGFSGLKDRHAVTRQWFSVPWRPGDVVPPFVAQGVSVLTACRHPRKLRRGVHSGNRFTLRLRELEGAVDDVPARVALLVQQGFPNYFGEQRFGRNGANVARAMRWVERGGRLRPAERGRHFSTLRALVFNALLSQRVSEGDWATLLPGDVCQWRGSASIFPAAELDAELLTRCETGELSPALPLVGGGAAIALGARAAWLETALAPWQPVVAALATARVEQSWRASRCRPEALEWALVGRDLLLQFTLPSGSFATALLWELLAYRDESQAATEHAA
jgi:tRNA pseudouridine13 synthase